MRQSSRHSTKRAAFASNSAAAPKRARNAASQSARPAQSPLANLPPELLPLIFRTAHSLGHTSTILALQRASKACWEIVTPLLYQHVRLRSDEDYESFLHVAHKDAAGLTDKLLRGRLQQVIGEAKTMLELPEQWQRAFRMWDMMRTLELVFFAQHELGRTTKLIFGVMKRIGRDCLLARVDKVILNCKAFFQPTRTTASNRRQTFSNSWGTAKHVNPRLLCVYDAHCMREGDFYTIQNVAMCWPALERVSIHGAGLEEMGRMSCFGVANDFYVAVPFTMGTEEAGDDLRNGLGRRVTLNRSRCPTLEDYRTKWNIIRCSPAETDIIEDALADAVDSYRRYFVDGLESVIDGTDTESLFTADSAKTKPLQKELEDGSCWEYRRAGDDDFCAACHGTVPEVVMGAALALDEE